MENVPEQISGEKLPERCQYRGELQLSIGPVHIRHAPPVQLCVKSAPGAVQITDLPHEKEDAVLVTVQGQVKSFLRQRCIVLQ